MSLLFENFKNRNWNLINKSLGPYSDHYKRWWSCEIFVSAHVVKNTDT